MPRFTCDTCGEWKSSIREHVCPPAWTVILAPLELYRLGYGLPATPADVKALTKTIYATSAEMAAAKYMEDFDGEQRHEFAKDENGLWVEVQPADKPAAAPHLYCVECQMVPEYTCSEPAEIELKRYHEAMERHTKDLAPEPA